MGHIFISYSHQDKDYVHKLQETLQNKGFDAWIDDRIDYGEEWLKVIEKHLDGCDAFILVMSNNSRESEMVQNEVTRARDNKKAIFPLLLDGRNWLVVQAKQYVDVTDQSMPTEKFFSRLEKFTQREKNKRKSPEKPKHQTVKPIPVEETARKTSHIEPKVPETQTFQRNSAIQVAFWGIGIIAVIFVISMLALNNWNKQSVIMPTSTYTASPSKTPEIVIVSTKSSTSTAAITSTNTTVLMPTDLPTEFTDARGVSMALVPAGEFIMGSSKETQANMLELCQDCNSESIADQSPQRSIYLDAFWIDKTEVTIAQFQKFIESESYVTSAEKKGYSLTFDKSSKAFLKTLDVNWRNPEGISIDLNQYADYPVTHVSWIDAQNFCGWAGKRLPTEAEWEKAARWVDGRFFPWGNTVPHNIHLNFNYAENGPVAVMNYPSGVSEYGVYDMAGNVWEWVNDWYSDNYTQSETDNPSGPNSGPGHVFRGGSWASELRKELVNVMTTFRYYNVSDFTSVLIGFRCAMDAP